MNRNGKGDKRRPSFITKEQFDKNYMRIFGKKKQKKFNNKKHKVLFCSYAQSGALLLIGDHGARYWTTPVYKGKEKYKDLPEGVYEADNGMLYTFDHNKATVQY